MAVAFVVSVSLVVGAVLPSRLQDVLLRKLGVPALRSTSLEAGATMRMLDTFHTCTGMTVSPARIAGAAAYQGGDRRPACGRREAAGAAQDSHRRARVFRLQSDRGSFDTDRHF